MKKFMLTVTFIAAVLFSSACSGTSQTNSDNSSDVNKKDESRILSTASVSSDKESSVSSDISENITESQETTLPESHDPKDNSSNDSSDNSENESSNEESKDGLNENIKTSSSSLTSPLESGLWGTASKYCTKEQNYINVPVRITSVEHGQKAVKTVKEFMSESSAYNYIEPVKDAEWVVAEYEISLKGFPVDEGGADSTITSFITSNDGGYLNYGDKKWNTTTINITDGKYYYEGIVKGKIAYQMISGRSDYIIALGEYDETQAFFKE